MLDPKVLIPELLSVNGVAASAVSRGEVSALQHEAGDDAVEAGAAVTVTVLAYEWKFIQSWKAKLA